MTKPTNPDPLTIRDARKAKAELESAIEASVNKFSQETGLTVTDISYDRVSYEVLGVGREDPASIMYNVRVKVTL